MRMVPSASRRLASTLDGSRGVVLLAMACPYETSAGTWFPFAGEEFPEAGIPEHLKAQGHSFEADGPSYLVHRYEEEQDFPARLNGRFHGVIADLARETVLLFNDRFGMQRLYYHQSGDTLYFGSGS